MPSNMRGAQWNAIQFINNSKLAFGGEWINLPMVYSWNWAFTQTIRDSIVAPWWVGS